ncbi:VanZ family protein [Methylobacillus arboreus]|uniref:VanZ family protein n=1 Tax=Methylobacillus arboreus TaxID=755170 RepID=UPI001E51414E|nr:VanZ family protein [Methylobacillus arboreus]MCB5190837.1 VanZ family protein [Methylobacillus arboreus]
MTATHLLNYLNTNILITPERLKFLALGMLILVIAGIFIGGEAPGAGSLFPPPWDKVVHFFAFGTIGVLAGLAFPRLPLGVAWVLVVLIGAADELHQLFIQGRQAGLDDLLADALGGLAALPVIALLRRWLLKG